MSAQLPPPPRPGGPHAAGHGGHGWMMIACCIPMIVIAIILVATGVASPGFLFVAVMCTAMMALMMRGMDHGSGAARDDTDQSTPAHHGR
jgi:hypothetical protein